MIYSGITESFMDLREVIDKSIELLRPYDDRFDSIVATGISGLCVAPALVYALDKELVVIRKADDKTNHSYTGIENARGLGRSYLFVDDFIAGGRTLRRVRAIIGDIARVGMRAMSPYEAGVMMYADCAVDWDSGRWDPETVRAHIRGNPEAVNLGAAA